MTFHTTFLPPRMCVMSEFQVTEMTSKSTYPSSQLSTVDNGDLERGLSDFLTCWGDNRLFEGRVHVILTLESSQ